MGAETGGEGEREKDGDGRTDRWTQTGTKMNREVGWGQADRIEDSDLGGEERDRGVSSGLELKIGKYGGQRGSAADGRQRVKATERLLNRQRLGW